MPIGGALTRDPAAALVAQLDPKIVIPMPVCEDEADCDEALKQFLHEMGAEPTTQPKLPSRPRACRPRRRPSSWSRAARSSGGPRAARRPRAAVERVRGQSARR